MLSAVRQGPPPGRDPLGKPSAGGSGIDEIVLDAADAKTTGAVRVAVEAGVRQPWDRWLLGQGGREWKAAFVGMSSFGASAPAEVLYERFGITAENVAQVAQGLL